MDGILKLAKQKLSHLERLSQHSADSGDQKLQQLRTLNQAQAELPLVEEDEGKSAVWQMLQQLDPDDLTPKQALTYLYQLKTLIN